MSSKPRKTVPVNSVRSMINYNIEYSATHFPERTRERQALAIVLSSILMDTGNYNGFGYNNDYPANPSADHTNVRYF